MTAERPYKSEPNIKDNSAIVYLVGANKLDPLRSMSVKKLIDDDKITENAINFLSECFKRWVQHSVMLVFMIVYSATVLQLKDQPLVTC